MTETEAPEGEEAEQAPGKVFVVKTTINQEENVAKLIDSKAEREDAPVYAVLAPNELRGYLFVEAESGAHLNRIPDAVGVWVVDPETGSHEVVREPDTLPVEEPGVEILDRGRARTDVRVAGADAKARARRRVAERAYGKGWRPAPPACARVAPDGDGLPYCPWKERVVDPGRDCGPDCGGHEPADPPDVDRAGLRATRTPWEPDPEGRRRRQSRLDRY